MDITGITYVLVIAAILLAGGPNQVHPIAELGPFQTEAECELQKVERLKALTGFDQKSTEVTLGMACLKRVPEGYREAETTPAV